MDKRVDDSFFNSTNSSAHVKQVKGYGSAPNVKKHFKGKKEKLRRVYGDQDA